MYSKPPKVERTDMHTYPTPLKWGHLCMQWIPPSTLKKKDFINSGVPTLWTYCSMSISPCSFMHSAMCSSSDLPSQFHLFLPYDGSCATTGRGRAGLSHFCHRWSIKPVTPTRYCFLEREKWGEARKNSFTIGNTFSSSVLESSSTKHVVPPKNKDIPQPSPSGISLSPLLTKKCGHQGPGNGRALLPSLLIRLCWWGTCGEQIYTTYMHKMISTEKPKLPLKQTTTGLLNMQLSPCLCLCCIPLVTALNTAANYC